jgi:centromeric protein E
LRLHEHPEQGFYVKATEVMVSSEDEMMQLMDSGEAHRHVGQTNMNEKSSRSHTLFRITIESKVEIADDEEAGSDSDEEDHQAGLCIRAATLNLVDLAGSERVGDTGAEGVRLKEAGQINKSLLTLGTVIKKLAEGDLVTFHTAIHS